MDLDSWLKSCTNAIKQQAFHRTYWKTFDVIEADTQRLKNMAYNIRYQVYCEENQFINPDNFEDRNFIDHFRKEIDDFDDDAIHFLLLHRASSQPVGTVRLLLPQSKHPLTSFELQKACDHPLLQIENRVMGLCEISRLCMLKRFRQRNRDGKILPAYYEQEWNDDENGKSGISFFRRRIPYAPLGLFMAVFETALDRGISNCIMSIEPDQIETLARLGIPYRVLGPRLNVYGPQQPLVFNIKSVLDTMATDNPECWEIITDKGRLQAKVDLLYLNDWHDTVFDEECRQEIIRTLL